jgi:hypothetical protein
VSDTDMNGKACALTVITPIARGEEDSLRAYLESLPRRDGPLANLPGTHLGRWVIVTGLDHEDLERQCLIFTSNFDGPLDPYMDALCALPEARAIWRRSSGAGDDLKAYLLSHRVKTGVFFAAYPQATLEDVERSLDRRERLIDFAVSAQEMDPAQLQAAFDAEFRA